MSTEAVEHDEWDGMGELTAKRICRFCLSQQLNKLTNIYAAVKSAAPLPSQVMAIASIEIHSKDGMPSWICSDCRLLFENAYCFKLMCKRADTLLRQFPLTGKWPDPLFKPNISDFSSSNSKSGKFAAKQKPVKRILATTVSGPRKLLNSNPAATPEPPVPLRVKREKLDDETMLFLNKVENDEELSMDDVQRLIAASDDAEEESIAPPVEQKKQTGKPKLLNKSSIRILNKDAEKILEPHVKWNDYGHMEIVTEILDPLEPDPITTANPVETNVFPCPHCERTFPLRQLRDIHMVNHNRERSFQCSGCEKSFFSKYDLQKHNLTHTGDRPFKCTICNKGFTRTTLLHRHEKTHADIPKFICVYCEKAFISKDEMEKHTERHLKNRPFVCKVCQKAFAFKQGLERHEIVHSRVQPYPCQYCEQSFPTPTKLSRHLTAHAGKRPYPCKFCSKSYLMSHHLTRHLRSHKQGVAAFHCNDCEKIFKTRDELIFHSATHAAKTLVCPLCKERFTKVETVTAHIKQHAEGEAFACEFCDMIFLTSDRLHDHTMDIHIDEMQAYQEDENTKAQKQSAVEKEDAIEQSEGDLQYAIDEFLIFDGDTASMKSKEPQKPIDVIKKQNISKKPTIVSQIVLQPKSFVGAKNNSATGDDNQPIEVQQSEMSDPDYTEEEEEEDDEDDVPLKYRKTATGSSPKIVHAVANEKGQDASPDRRKAANEKSTIILPKMPTLKPIKIEMNDLIVPAPKLVKLANSKEKQAIDNALKALPKSVSVRRKLPTVLSTTTLPVKQMAPPTPKFRIVTRLASAQAEAAPKPSASKPPDTTKEANSNTKQSIEKPSQVKKNVTLQKIMITKAEADALIKGGRIRMKDGNMVLTQSIVKPKSSQ